MNELSLNTSWTRLFVKSLAACVALFALLLPLVSHSETTSNSIKCHALLGQVESIRTESDPQFPKDWEYAMTRNSNRTSSVYLKNITRSTFEVFRPWFEGQNSVSFEKMLRDQHRMTILGADSKELYLSVTGLFQDPKDLFPGILRSDSSYPHRDAVEKIRLQEETLLELIFPKTLINEMKRQNSKEFLTSMNRIPIFAQTKRLKMNFEKDYDEDSLRPVQRFTWTHGYASSHMIPVYMKAMEQVMVEIKNLPQTPENRIQLLRLLAEYHQLFINALPFRRVNNSIAMSHINYILLSWGMKGISHGHLDLICLVTSTEQYQKYFIGTVKFENPDLVNL